MGPGRSTRTSSTRIAATVVLLLSAPLPAASARPLPVGSGAVLRSLRVVAEGGRVEGEAGAAGLETVLFDGAASGDLLAVSVGDSVRVEDWPTAPGVRKPVSLRRFDVYSPDARIVVVQGGETRPVPRSRLAFFIGNVDGGETRETVVAWIDPDDGRVGGLVQGGSGTIAIEPGGPGSRWSRVARPEALLSPGVQLPQRCAVGDEAPPREPDRRIAPPARVTGERLLLPPAGLETRAPLAVPSVDSASKTAVIAIDTDAEYLSLRFGNDTTAAASWIAQLIAGASAIYERDVGSGQGNGVRILQGYTILRVGEGSDPYSDTTGNVVSSDPRLAEFQSYWAANYPSSVVKRSLAALLSGRQGGSCSLSGCSASGIAWIGGLCNGYGYSLNQLFNVNFGISWDLLIFAHEVGHNFGAYHTHSCVYGTPPIDTCLAAEGGCSPQGSCPAPQTINGVGNVTGTLMSYCHTRGDGCTSSLVFHPLTVTGTAAGYGLLASVAAASCLASVGGGGVPAAPTVTGISLPTGPLAGGRTVTITGTGFASGATVAFVELPSNDVFGAGLAAKALTSVAFGSSTSLTAVTPAAAAVGSVDVVVMNPDQQTARLAGGYAYTAAQPPTVTAVVPNTGSTLGGSAVTITGTGFQSLATVAVGGAAASSVVVVGATTITAVTPAHSTGTVSVAVTNPDLLSGSLAGAYFFVPPPGARALYLTSPCRLLDTRSSTPPEGASPSLAAGSVRQFSAAGKCSIPSSAVALAANVTATGQTASGGLSLFPGNGIPPAPPVTAVAFGPGRNQASELLLRLSTDGSQTISVQNSSTGSVDLVVDVSGYFQ